MRARRQAGFTALELLASTLILMLVMLIAIQMLGEAGRLLSSAQVELGEPSMELTRQWLRRDVQGASALGGLWPLPLEVLWAVGRRGASWLA